MPCKAENAFFLFGMGNRHKYFYKNGKLYDSTSCKVIRNWVVETEELTPATYSVKLKLKNGKIVDICENEDGVYIFENGQITILTESKIHLPDFHEYEHPELMCILHHEILINIINGVPVPNYFVYKKPWYRDGAMMAMVLKETGNLFLIKNWVEGLNEFYDYNNKGNREPDNIGQLMFLISCCCDQRHPLIPSLIQEAKRNCINGVPQGLTDYGNHPVYAAKWLKYGLEALKYDSSWVTIPNVADDYSQLFWMDYKDCHIDTYRRQYDSNYPYLWWAEQHFFGNPIDPKYLKPCYPISNETMASEANYEGIRPLSEEYANLCNASPHTWHAAEMFLYLVDNKRKLVNK